MAAAAMLGVGIVLATLPTLIAINVLLILLYVGANGLKVLLITRSLKAAERISSEEQRGPVEWVGELPTITVLIPLYREALVVGQLIDGLKALDYPSERLDVKLLLEADDGETWQALESQPLPPFVEKVMVTGPGPAGKPRALNVGLQQARGTYLAVYDAEDQPETDQLLKAVAAFQRLPAEVVCLQARLNYFNRSQNLLTRWFTSEYSMWFDLLLPGLHALDAPIPLGGTSNFFITERLRELDGWDRHNVTEDADLGLRIYARGWKVDLLDSTTFEEANSRPYNWIRQRSRWVKGYLQTYLVHMREPTRLYRVGGAKAFLAFHLFFAGAIVVPLINPLYWLLTALWFGAHVHVITLLFPPPVFYAGSLALLFGNLAFVYAHISGCFARENYGDVKWALLSPLYWVLMSVGAWKGVLQLVHKPHYWEKTRHGFALRDHAEPV